MRYDEHTRGEILFGVRHAGSQQSGLKMSQRYSPLKSLASFAIAFAAGAVASSTVAWYGQWQYRQGRKAASKDATGEWITRPPQEVAPLANARQC